MHTNSFNAQVAANKMCACFGVKMVPAAGIVQIAQNAGFEALFIDTEHTTLSIDQVSSVCVTALIANITPFVRVPYQCGSGFVQRVLDGGACGVVFPHVSSEDEAKEAVSRCKYPPMGKRSATGQLPHFNLKPTPQAEVIKTGNAEFSTVIVMIETPEAVKNADAIASVKGVDVVLVGSNDLSTEMGIPGQYTSDDFQNALRQVSKACKAHGKAMGLGGIYDNAELQRWAIQDLGVRFMLSGQDQGWIAKAAAASRASLKELE